MIYFSWKKSNQRCINPEINSEKAAFLGLLKFFVFCDFLGSGEIWKFEKYIFWINMQNSIDWCIICRDLFSTRFLHYAHLTYFVPDGLHEVFRLNKSGEMADIFLFLSNMSSDILKLQENVRSIDTNDQLFPFFVLSSRNLLKALKWFDKLSNRCEERNRWL